jgi:hypothetical protein
LPVVAVAVELAAAVVLVVTEVRSQVNPQVAVRALSLLLLLH